VILTRKYTPFSTIYSQSSLYMYVYMFICMHMHVCVYVRAHTCIHPYTAVSYGWDSVIACFCKLRNLANSGIEEEEKHG
jgi:hypothetical protein